MERKIETNLTQGSVTGQLVRYAMPLVGTSVLQAVYSITDMIIAGRFIGNVGLSAINNASLVMNLLTQIIIGLTIGGNVLIGQYYGAGDHENRKQAAGSLFAMCAVLGVASSAVFLIVARPLVILLGAPALDEAAQYLRICAGGLFFIFGYNALAAILRALGNSRKTLHFIVLATAVNVVLDLLFVAVFRWGVAGAAAATVTAQGVSFGAALLYLVRHRQETGFTRRYIRFAADKCRRIFQLGFPLVMQWTAASVSWLVVAFLINKYGVDVSAGNGVSAKIKDFCQLFITAFSSGAATMIAQNLGAGEHERARRVMVTCMKVTLGIAALLIVVIELSAPWLVMVFTRETAVQYWAVYNLRIEIVAQLFYAGFYTYHALATGSGHTMFVFWSSFTNCIVVRVVLAVLFESIWGITGVFVACFIAPFISVPLGHAFYRSGRWKGGLVDSRTKTAG